MGAEKNAILINCARGPIVDPVALQIALQSGQIEAAGLDVTEFQAYYGSSATPETIRYTVGGYVAWMKNFRIFDEAVALGEVDRSTLDTMAENMLKWSDNPDAFVAMGRCTAIGVK